jgi:hypothetical protein
VLGYPENGADSLVQRVLSSRGRWLPGLAGERVGSPKGGSWEDARQDHNDDELNFAVLPCILCVFARDWIWDGFLVKRKELEN